MIFNKTTFPNGLRVITVPIDDNPAVTVLVMVTTGSEYESKEINGISHFLEHMMFKGTKTRPRAKDISNELESLGAHYNAFTGNEYTGYYAKVSKENVDEALDIISDIYLNPLLEQTEIDKEKGVITEEIKMYQDMPQRQVQEIFSSLVYGDQPAGWGIAGEENTIKKFNSNDFQKYLGEHYTSSNTIVVISGSINEKEIIDKVSNKFKTINIGEKTQKPKVAENQSKPELIVKYKDSDQAHMVMGVRTFDSKNDFNPILSVLGVLLGGGMSSRLFQKLREEMGVCYYINAGNDTYTDHGIFTISAGVDVKRINEVIKTIISECKKIINEEITEKELKRVKDYMSGSFLLSLETSDSRAEYVAMAEILKGKIITPKERIEKIQKVTVEEIKNIAKEIFVDEKLNLAIIGPYKDDTSFKEILTFK